MKRSLAMMLALIMVCALPGIASANGNSSIESAGITHDNGILKNAVSIDLKDITFKTSVQVKLYSGDTLLTTATLQGVKPGSYGFLTCCIATETADANWALTPWTPKDNVVPDKAVLVVDGQELNTKTFTLDADEWAKLTGTASPGSIERAVITREKEGTLLKNAVSIDLKDITFAESVQVKLFSDETLLTTATLNEGFVDANQLQKYVTCCIPTKGADEAWSLTPWIPRDKIVPNKAVLFVDGNELDTKKLTLDAEAWAALPGTVPYSGSINGACITQNAVSIELEDITFEKSVQVELFSDKTLLTTATLKVNENTLKANTYYQFVTCCIPTVGEDEAWSLTPWTPKDDVIPNEAVLVVDGHEENRKNFTLNDEEWAALPGTAFPYSGSIERAGITHDNGVLKNAVSVDLKNVNFESSVQVQLYSGETLLTTATLQGVNPGSYGFLTCCIATETADANWALTPWTPKDDVVPNKVVLFVDGNKMDTMEFTLDAAEWKALPGTVLPSSNVTNGTTSNNDKLDNVPQTGDTSNFALWIALLFVSGGAAIGTTIVSKKKEYNK